MFPLISSAIFILLQSALLAGLEWLSTVKCSGLEPLNSTLATLY
jgi:hypothetical protein